MQVSVQLQSKDFFPQMFLHEPKENALT